LLLAWRLERLLERLRLPVLLLERPLAWRLA
jgi:hypothetical protein